MRTIKILRPGHPPAWVFEDDVEITVSADGYVRTNTPIARSLECILSFPQVVAAMEEEKRPWWREQ